MKRQMFTVAPARSGWQLYEDTEGRDWFGDVRQALAAATALAAHRNSRTGMPTGVILDVCSGERLLMGLYG